MTTKRTESHLAPSLSTQPRCPHHAYALLRSDGTCPTCEREAFMARVKSAEEAADLRKLQAVTRVVAGKRRAPTLREVLA